MATRFQFIGGAYQGDTQEQDPQECVNLLYKPNAWGGKNALVSRPGLKQFCDTGNKAEVRGLCDYDNVLYAVVGDKLFSISRSGVATEITSGNKIVSKTGLVTMAVGLGYVVIADGTYGYVYSVTKNEITILSRESPHWFLGGNSIDFLNSKWISAIPDSNRFTYSEVSNPKNYMPESSTSPSYMGILEPEGDIVRIIVDKGEIVVFKKKGIEFVEHMPGDVYDYRLRTGTSMSVGILTGNSVTRANNTFYWIGDDFNVYMANGYSPSVISVPQISRKFSEYETVSDAFMLSYTIDSTTYLQITFPTEQKTWLYDVATQLWTNLSSWQDYSSAQGRHRANCYCWFNRKHLVGDYRNGRIYEMSYDYHDDDGQSLQWKRVCPVLDNSNELFTITEMEIELSAGTATRTGSGSNPKLIMKYSVDGGHTWSKNIEAGVGERGEYDKRVIFGPCGTSRSFIFEVYGSDPIKWVFTGAGIR